MATEPDKRLPFGTTNQQCADVTSNVTVDVISNNRGLHTQAPWSQRNKAVDATSLQATSLSTLTAAAATLSRNLNNNKQAFIDVVGAEKSGQMSPAPGPTTSKPHASSKHRCRGPDPQDTDILAVCVPPAPGLINQQFWPPRHSATAASSLRSNVYHPGGERLSSPRGGAM